MKPIKISDTDENADWIKWRTDDVEVSEVAAKRLGDKERKEKKEGVSNREIIEPLAKTV